MFDSDFDPVTPACLPTSASTPIRSAMPSPTTGPRQQSPLATPGAFANHTVLCLVRSSHHRVDRQRECPTRQAGVPTMLRSSAEIRNQGVRSYSV